MRSPTLQTGSADIHDASPEDSSPLDITLGFGRGDLGFALVVLLHTSSRERGGLGATSDSLVAGFDHRANELLGRADDRVDLQPMSVASRWQVEL